MKESIFTCEVTGFTICKTMHISFSLEIRKIKSKIKILKIKMRLLKQFCSPSRHCFCSIVPSRPALLNSHLDMLAMLVTASWSYHRGQNRFPSAKFPSLKWLEAASYHTAVWKDLKPKSQYIASAPSATVCIMNITINWIIHMIF